MPKKVSLKEIVKAIDKVLSELEDGGSKAKGPTTAPGDERVERTKKILRGVRESVEGACLPDFNVPTP